MLMRRKQKLCYFLIILEDFRFRVVEQKQCEKYLSSDRLSKFIWFGLVIGPVMKQKYKEIVLSSTITLYYIMYGIKT